MNFDPVAPIYDRLAKGIFGPSIQSIQTDLLSDLPLLSEILILGGGSGWIIDSLRSYKPYKRLVFIEDSQKMLSLAHARLSHMSFPKEFQDRTLLLFGRENYLFSSQKFSVLITPFFLDLFSEKELPAVYEAIENHLYPGALWLVVDFARGKNNGNPLFGVILRGMYLFFRWTCGLRNQKLPDIQSFVINQGFTLEKEAHRWGGFMRAQLYRKC